MRRGLWSILIINLVFCTSVMASSKKTSKKGKASAVSAAKAVTAEVASKPVVLSRISLLKKEKVADTYTICVDYFYPKNPKEARLNYSGMGNLCWKESKISTSAQNDYEKCFQRLQLEFRRRVEAKSDATVGFVQKNFQDIGKTYQFCSHKIDVSGPWPVVASYVMVHSDIRK